VNTWKVILAALVIFGAGLVTGNVLNRISDESKAAATTATPRSGTRTSSQPPISLEQLRKVELMGRVQKELELTPEQHARIEKIISDAQERISELWQQVAPDIHDEYDDVQKKLCEELTPDQKKLFDDLMKKQQHPPHKPGSTNAPPQAMQNQKHDDGSVTKVAEGTPALPSPGQ
jgi:Spy/CpxP family protein refolding chaperone